jgi:urease accessory protein
MNAQATAPIPAPAATVSDGTGVVAGCESSDNHNWRAWLDLSFEKGRDKTILRRKHYGPLVIQRPFYPEGRVCHAYILHPPGGVVGGDKLSIDVRCGNGAEGLITTPGANRFYGSDGWCAHQYQNILVGDGCFEWMPMESIYFDRAQVSQQLNIELTQGSRFIAWDINCFGRIAGNHEFRTGAVANRISVFRNGVPVFIDRLCISGAEDLQRITGLRGASVSGTMLLSSAGAMCQDTLDLVRTQLDGQSNFAATLIEKLIIVRYLGSNAEQARTVFSNVRALMRPILMPGKPAVQPRIWAT